MCRRRKSEHNQNFKISSVNRRLVVASASCTIGINDRSSVCRSGHCSRSERRHSARKSGRPANTGGVWLLLMPQKRFPQRTLFCSLLRIWRILWISQPCSSCHWRTRTPCRTCRRPHRRVSSPPEKVQTSTCRLRQVRVHHIPQVRFHRLPQASEVPLRRRLRTSVMIIGAPLGGPGF